MKLKVRFSNEDTPIEVPNFDWSEFRAVNIFDDVVFGWYGKGSISGQHYVAIDRKDYDNKK